MSSDRRQEQENDGDIGISSSLISTSSTVEFSSMLGIFCGQERKKSLYVIVKSLEKNWVLGVATKE